MSLPAQRPITSGGTVSVPTRIVEPAGSSQSSGSAATRDGGRIMWVIRRSRRKSVSAGPATRTSSGASTSLPPTVSAMVSSNTATSKPTEANWSTRLSVLRSILSTAVAARLAMPSCGTTTPLGLPVEPDV